MDREPQQKRQKKKDKAKEKFERNGKFSAKHIRLALTTVNGRVVG